MTIEERCTAIADKVVPQYRHGTRSYSCGGHIARLWQAAWDGAYSAAMDIEGADVGIPTGTLSELTPDLGSKYWSG